MLLAHLDMLASIRWNSYGWPQEHWLLCQRVWCVWGPWAFLSPDSCPLELKYSYWKGLVKERRKLHHRKSITSCWPAYLVDMQDSVDKGVVYQLYGNTWREASWGRRGLFCLTVRVWAVGGCWGPCIHSMGVEKCLKNVQLSSFDSVQALEWHLLHAGGFPSLVFSRNGLTGMPRGLFLRWCWILSS